MLAIKLKRVGKKHQASFRLVVLPKKSKLQGKFIEDLGWYNPRTRDRNFRSERINYWLSVGAKATDTVHNLLVDEKIIEKKKIPVHKVRKSEVKTETEKK